MDTQPPEPGENDMTIARDLTRQASEALDQGSPDAARALADLALVYFRLGLPARPRHRSGPWTHPAPGTAPADLESSTKPPAALPQSRGTQDWDQHRSAPTTNTFPAAPPQSENK